MLCKSMEWFLYDKDIRHKRVKRVKRCRSLLNLCNLEICLCHPLVYSQPYQISKMELFAKTVNGFYSFDWIRNMVLSSCFLLILVIVWSNKPISCYWSFSNVLRGYRKTSGMKLIIFCNLTHFSQMSHRFCHHRFSGVFKGYRNVTLD